MKGIYAIVIAFLAFWDISTAEVILPVPTECPLKERDNFTTTNLPHESDCTKFYKCLKTWRFEEDCPFYDEEKTKRLHYNIFEQVCDWPWRAGCEICPDDKEIGERLGESLIPGKNKCSFIKCKNGKQVGKEKQCPKKTCFSRTCQECVKNGNGGACDGSGNTTPPDSGERSCEEGDRQPHDCNCGKYYECDEDGNLIVYECKPGLHFSEEISDCTTPDIAECKIKRKKSNFPDILNLLRN